MTRRRRDCVCLVMSTLHGPSEMSQVYKIIYLYLDLHFDCKIFVKNNFVNVKYVSTNAI